LPVPHPEQLVALHTSIADNVNSDEDFTWPMFEELSRQQELFSDIFAWEGGSVSNFEVDGAHYAAALATASGSYYQGMQTAPLLGRYIGPGDVATRNGVSSAVAVISYRIWRNWFHRDSHILGRELLVDGHLFTVIGVEPEGFSGLLIDGGSDVTVPVFAPGTSADRGPHTLHFSIFARLKPGVTVNAANAGIRSLWPHVQEVTMPSEYSGESKTRFFARRIELESAATGMSFLRKRFSFSLKILMAIAGAVLFVACLNIANLSLAKAAAHSRQSGVRAALGANLWDLLRPPLAESLLLSFGGAALGLMVAYVASPLILRTAYTGYFGTTISAAPDLRVLGFTLLIALATGILFGIIPAWYAARIDPIDALKNQSRSVSGGSNWFGKTLLVTQIAFSLVLMLAALLFGRTLSALHTSDTGYRRDHLLTLQLFPQAGATLPANPIAYYQDLAEKVRSIPGVENVSYSNDGPANEFEYLYPVYGSLAQSPLQAIREHVGPGFFSTAGMHFLAGRDLRWSDAKRDAVILSQSLAERLFGKQSPVGRTIYLGPPGHTWPVTIIGVVNSASLWKVESIHPLAVYVLYEPDSSWNEPLMDVRTSIDPNALKASVERVIRSMGHHYSLRTMTVSERLDSHITVQRLTAFLSEFFGAVALLIACVGLYGLMSFHVTRRTTELGIRSALGAGRNELLFLVIREALVLASCGCLLGLLASLAAGRFLVSILFGVTPADPELLAITLVTMLAVATVAAFLPAMRAARVDPMIALRAE
jgi:predicted permease